MNTGIRKGQVEHKYDYAAVQFETPAYGWSSTREHVGLWLVTPSYEYMSDGPTKLELSAHPDATFTHSLADPAPPVILNVWKGPQYGGTVLDVRKARRGARRSARFCSTPTPLPRQTPCGAMR
jgi:rhamnogalacturonan endolyase